MMGKPAAPISAEHAELLRGYRLDQERRGLLPSSIELRQRHQEPPSRKARKIPT